jgi:hypothetical protein
MTIAQEVPERAEAIAPDAQRGHCRARVFEEPAFETNPYRITTLEHWREFSILVGHIPLSPFRQGLAGIFGLNADGLRFPSRQPPSL